MIAGIQAFRMRTVRNVCRVFCGCLTRIFMLMRQTYDWIFDFILSFFFNDSKSLKIPGVKEKFLLESAVSLASRIRKKELTSEQVVKGFIDRIEEVNPMLNAVVDKRFYEAIKEAQAADEFLKTTKLTEAELKEQKPFLGVPFTNKESTAGKGLSFTFGLLARKGIKATEDADIVKKYKDTGAILVGSTNVPELNLWTETRNNIYGTTVNPYNTNRTVGGSSGGEGCIVAACGSPIGLGTDIGGSCRMPAFYCDLFAHKPTTGLISTKGMTFRQGGSRRTMVCAGPMVKYAEDLASLTTALFQVEDEAIAEKAKLMQLTKEVKMEDINFFFIDEPGDRRVSPVSDDIRKVIYKATRFLRELTGRPPVKAQLTNFQYSYSLWRYWMTQEGESFAKLLGNNQRTVSLVPELIKTFIGRSQFTLPAILKMLDDCIMPKVSPDWAVQTTRDLKTQVLELLGDNGVLIFPSCPSPAGYHYSPFFRPYNFAYWAIFNVLELPVTQVPMGLNEKGLPVGFQVVATPYNDHLTISVAKALDKEFGGYTAPFPL